MNVEVARDDDLLNSLVPPLLLLSHSGRFLATNNLSHVLRCTRLGYRTGYYRGLTIVDSAGRGFTLRDAKKKRTIVSNFGQFFGLITGNPTWEVALIADVQGKRQFAFEDVKSWMLRDFARDQELWEEMCDVESFESELRAADSFDSLFAVFRKYHQM